jgi:hypothetical protein
MSTEEKKADREKRMSLVMEAAQEEDPDTFKFMTQQEKKAAAAKSKDKEKKQGSKRKAVNSDSDADDESELSEAEEAGEDEDSENEGKAKGKAKVDAAKKGQASKVSLPHFNARLDIELISRVRSPGERRNADSEAEECRCARSRP